MAKPLEQAPEGRPANSRSAKCASTAAGLFSAAAFVTMILAGFQTKPLLGWTFAVASGISLVVAIVFVGRSRHAQP